MRSDYYIIHKSILPEYLDKVIYARNLLSNHEVNTVTEAVQMAGISRNTYYKYKDFIFEPSDMEGGRRAVLSMLLDHEAGVLSALLQCISGAGASVLTIDQSLPIHEKASVTIALDLGGMTVPLQELLDGIGAVPGVENTRLIAIE